MKKRKLIKIAAVLLGFCLLTAFLQALVMPKYVTQSREGNLIREYYREEGTHDVLFVGDCEVYGNFSPAALWRSCGLTSYIRGSAEQLIWQSYYLLEEMLETEQPKAVVYNVLAMKHGEPDSEAYNRMTLDGMRWSSSKLQAVRASMTEDESFLSYLFPLLRFHSRWSELSGEDLQWLFDRPQVSYNGYLPVVGVKAADVLPSKRPLPDYSFSDTVWEYLDRMRLLCEEKGVTLILIKAPVLYPYWYEEWDEQVETYAERWGLAYYNMLDAQEEIGLDYSADTYDGGLHLNVEGAEKAAVWLGEKILKLTGPADHSGDAALVSLWEDKLAAYEAEICRQQTSAETAGKTK